MSLTTDKKKIKNAAPITTQDKPVWLWALFIVAATAVCLFPMLQNGFTNWDDDKYIVNNLLLHGPDWAGIFTKPVSSNYHPLTIATLAMNYQAGELEPFSYLLINYLLHLANVALVFYFILAISGRRVIVAGFTALIFGLHPMHVESVAWISERKDVLYTFFFLLALMQYCRYVDKGKKSGIWFCLGLFLLSVLSKPAAVVLPLILFLLDYWKGRKIGMAALIEKLPFFAVSIFFGILTVKMQLPDAIAGIEQYPVWARLLFACYVLMMSFFRFFIPCPLSAFHPYPDVHHLGWEVLVAPVFILLATLAIWRFRKERWVIFGALFFLVNLILVLQIVTIGSTLFAERYTYVPYIGLGFIFGMGLDMYILKGKMNAAAWAGFATVTIIFGYISHERTKVWKDSGTLWADVLTHYPDAPTPRTNRANYLLKKITQETPKDEADVLMQQALEDCNEALRANPAHAPGYETRAFINNYFGKYKEAIADANVLLKLDPKNTLGFATRGVAYVRMDNPDSALRDFNAVLAIDPDNEYGLDNRAALWYNVYKKYHEAIVDYTKAIQINPRGSYYLGRSYSYYKLDDITHAKEDAKMAEANGVVLQDGYKQAISY